MIYSNEEIYNMRNKDRDSERQKPFYVHSTDEDGNKVRHISGPDDDWGYEPGVGWINYRYY